MARVYLKGLPQLRAKLERIAKASETQVRATLSQAAEIVVAEIKSRAPWAHLVPSIGWTFGVPPKYAQVVARAGIGEVQVTIFVGDKFTRTAAWAEHGTRPHLIGGLFEGKMHPGTPPQPFFFPGWRAKKNLVRRMLREQIKLAVQRAAK